MKTLVLSLLCLVSFGSPGFAVFLERESLRLEMDGRHEVKTSLPLEEYKDYRVRVKSPYDLRPIWGVAPGTGHRYLLLFDGQFQDQDRMISPWNYADDMTELVWRWRGKGLPLTLRTAKDLTSVIRHATVEISRVKVAGEPAETPVAHAAPPLWKQAPATENFLERETLVMPTDGSAVHTSRPFAPYRMYAITLRSPYDLSPFLGSLTFDDRDARSELPVPAVEAHREQLELRYAFRGKGTPLTLRLSHDLSNKVPHANVDIVLDADGSLTAPPAPAVASMAQAPVPFPRRFRLLAFSLFGVVVSLTIAWCVWDYFRSQEAELRRRERALRQEEADRKEAELKEKAAPWMARARAEGCFLGAHFQRAYARAHTDEILTSYRDTWQQEYATISQDRELWVYLRTHATAETDATAWLDARMTIIQLAQQAAVGLLPDEPLPPEPPTPEQEAQAQLLLHAVELQQHVHLERNFLDQAYREDYARKHMHEVLSREGPVWFSEYRALQADQPLLELVREAFPEVLEFYEARLEVYRLARRLEVTPPPPDVRPPSTPEERERKVTRFRNRLLQWRETKAQDFIAQRVQQLDMLRAFEEELATYDLDEDERERLLQEFRQELDLIEPPKPKGKPDHDKENGDEGFTIHRPDR